MIPIAFPTLFEAEGLLAKIGKPKAKKLDGVECYEGKLGDIPIAVGIIGIGKKLAVPATTIFLRHFPAQELILTGFAGALSPQLKIGDVIVASNYATPDLLQHIRLLSGYATASLYTSDKIIETAQQKAQLATDTKCQAVDMETSFVAEAAGTVGTLILPVRVISDSADEDIPTKILAHGYDYKKGRPTPARMSFYLATHPFQAGALAKFVKKLPGAREKLTNFLVELLPELA